MVELSFAAYTKNELSKINNLKNKEEVYFELLGYLVSANITTTEKYAKFSTENEYNINRFAKLLSNLNIVNYKIDLQGKIYTIKFKKTEKINIENVLNNFEKLEEKTKKAYVRGAFLGSGYINNPEGKYHLEVIFKENKYANIVSKILSEYNIKSNILPKSKSYSLYIKDSEEISKFLAFIGANSSVIKFEEVRVMRDMKNNINRLVNCETANLNKTINAAVEQISIIKKLKKLGKFETLPDDLKEITSLREENPNATLEELGKMLKKPIGKSSVSNKFKRLKEYL